MGKKKIAVLGPPGAGKGTQSEKVSEYLSVPHISTGDILRNHKDLETEHGKAKDFMDKGELVPDKLVFELLDHRLSKKDVENGFVLDGFPRDKDQAEHMEELGGLNLLVDLEVDDEVLVKRLSGRRVCEKCGETYHIRYNPPEKEGVCGSCGNSLTHREDDKPEVIRERLKQYHKKTEPLVKFYKEKDVLEKVDGSKSIEKVWEEVKEVLNRKYS